MSDVSFSRAEICARAQGNATAWILTIIAYSKMYDPAAEDCVAYHGRQFAPLWEELRGLSVEDARAEVLVGGWPDEELLDFLPLDRDDCDQLWSTHEPIMEHLGPRYSWQRQDDVVRMTIEPQD